MNRWFTWFGVVLISFYLWYVVPLIRSFIECAGVTDRLGKQCALEGPFLTLPWSIWIDTSNLSPISVVAILIFNLFVLYGTGLLLEHILKRMKRG
jgi:hypothetical protein